MTRCLLSQLSLVVAAVATANGLAAPSTPKPRLRFFNSGTCPYAQRAWIALEESGAEYETIVVDLQDKSQIFLDLYARANPLPDARAKVPVLQVGDDGIREGKDETVALCESQIIAEYIGEIFFTPGGKGSLILPSALDRARARLFTQLCGDRFAYFPLLRAGGSEKADALETFKKGLVDVDTFLRSTGNGPFLFGDRFTLAECNAAPFVQRCCSLLPAFTGPDSDMPGPAVDPLAICDQLRLDRLKKWIEAVLARPSVAATGIPEDILQISTARMLERFSNVEAAGRK